MDSSAAATWAGALAFLLVVIIGLLWKSSATLTGMRRDIAELFAGMENLRGEWRAQRHKMTRKLRQLSRKMRRLNEDRCRCPERSNDGADTAASASSGTTRER